MKKYKQHGMYHRMLWVYIRNRMEGLLAGNNPIKTMHPAGYSVDEEIMSILKFSDLITDKLNTEVK